MAPRMIRFFAENWALKIAALALAFLLWMAVRATTDRRATFGSVQVEVDLRDPDWRLAGEPQPPQVSVIVTGPMSELWTLTNNPPRIVLPVERVLDPVETQVVPAHWVQLPPRLQGTRVVTVRPDAIRLQYERLVARMLPVTVRTRGHLPDGYALALPITTNPSLVELRGPVAAMEQLDSVRLQPVDLTDLRSTTNVPTAVDTARLAGFRVAPTEVNVILRIVPLDSPAPEPPTPRRRTGGPRG